MEKVYVFDSTLRDGAQAQGVSFSVSDKLKICRRLDMAGVDYIEAGNPGSNPKDLEFFARLDGEPPFSHARLTAFGSTRRPDCRVQDDTNVKALTFSSAPVIAIFGKSWDFHVRNIIRTSDRENLRMIADTIEYFKLLGKEVIFDAEHFFNGYRSNPGYALDVLAAAIQAGADWLVLCETNGGMLPLEVYATVSAVRDRLPDAQLGIHCHNDSGNAVANSIVAVQAGCRQVQGVFTGFGERCGNASLAAVIANLQLKLGFTCLPDASLHDLTPTYRYICSIANLPVNEREPYVGNCAFAHKGGMHVDAVIKDPRSFEHVDPESVGNQRRILMSEVAGRSTLLSVMNRIDPAIGRDHPATRQVLEKLKQLEHQGYQFEGAEHSLELIARRELGLFEHSFQLVDYKVIIENNRHETGCTAIAFIKILVDGVMEEVVVSDAVGPVHALDRALRKALHRFYDDISRITLTDYKVRVIDGDMATAAKVRVIVESSDGRRSWTTVGVSDNVIEASIIALIDAVEYGLIGQKQTA
ncbi:MAG: citramalate synthase [Negativicutes bacterium]|nr:citramalate synthase [Negativicutes bacterium]